MATLVDSIAFASIAAADDAAWRGRPDDSIGPLMPALTKSFLLGALGVLAVHCPSLDGLVRPVARKFSVVAIRAARVH